MVVGTETFRVSESYELGIRDNAIRRNGHILGRCRKPQRGVRRAEVGETFANGIGGQKWRSRLIDKLVSQVPVDSAEVRGASHSSAIHDTPIRDDLQWALSIWSATCVEEDKSGGHLDGDGAAAAARKWNAALAGASAVHVPLLAISIRARNRGAAGRSGGYRVA